MRLKRLMILAVALMALRSVCPAQVGVEVKKDFEPGKEKPVP